MCVLLLAVNDSGSAASSRRGAVLLLVETAAVETAVVCRLLGRGEPRGDILLLVGTAAIRRRLLLHARPMYISGASSSSEQQSADMSPLMVVT